MKSIYFAIFVISLVILLMAEKQGEFLLVFYILPRFHMTVSKPKPKKFVKTEQISRGNTSMTVNDVNSNAVTQGYVTKNTNCISKSSKRIWRDNNVISDMVPYSVTDVNQWKGLTFIITEITANKKKRNTNIKNFSTANFAMFFFSFSAW